ncbi:hypothetical protein LPJ70_005936 [Coemansia sp. RSA 2708]|nr:hypothetical protein LPJ70_005936 [Coemansia sp. RSA 2708]KAJ2315027.1 hypothetical protein IWW54_000560 [Coemansia sp. RSA 2705]KAJ2370421.1 hypothetical protein H4S01_000381 [Coemansia sp. RSA 2610]KAJ2739668.1 hypothetical protein H4R23_000299 [Coemansia sp. Cherry 401B]
MSLPDASSFQILETTVHTAEDGACLLDQHLARMRDSARQLRQAYGEQQLFDCAAIDSAAAVRAQIGAQLGSDRTRHRIRMLLAHTGLLTVQVTPEPPLASVPPLLVLDQQPSQTDSVFVRCKTTHRPMYTTAAQRVAARHGDQAQVLLYNHDGLITEGNIANVAVALPDAAGRLELVTPPLAAGLLPGTMRQRLLDTGRIREAPVTVAQFAQAVRSGWPVMCMNSVRGLYAVTPAIFSD